ncbi:MAG: hypothetical protein QW578_05635, partial [Thermoplasmatales archaeon]
EKGEEKRSVTIIFSDVAVIFCSIFLIFSSSYKLNFGSAPRGALLITRSKNWVCVLIMKSPIVTIMGDLSQNSK